MDVSQMLAAHPEVDFAALEDEILSTFLAGDNYLFYRTGFPFCDYPGVVEDEKPAWEMYCSGCRRRFFTKKKRGAPPSELTQCPECGAEMTAKKWMRRSKLETRILFYTFTRGEGRAVWLDAYRVMHDFSGEPGEECLYFEPAARYLFKDGSAQKWDAQRQYFGRTIAADWMPRARCTKTVWYINNNLYGAQGYPAYIGEISQKTIAGSCLEYSQLDRAIAAQLDIPEYLALYSKCPAVEYLWKMGLSHWIYEKIMVGGANFTRAVNVRASAPKALLRGLTRQEVRYIAENEIGCAAAAQYRRLRERGAVSCDALGFAWAKMTTCAAYSYVEKACAARGVKPAALRAYIGRQAARMRQRDNAALSDFYDYLRQNIDELNLADFEVLPQDLRTAHERLSTRLRRAATRKNLAAFRARRHALNWTRFARGAFFIRPTDSPDELVREGERQRNCVSSYENRHAAGETAIFVLRRRAAPQDSYCTLELDEKRLAVRQVRTYKNGAAPQEVLTFVKEWLAHLVEVRGAGEKQARKSV